MSSVIDQPRRAELHLDTISQLVPQFYDDVRADPLLGPLAAVEKAAPPVRALERYRGSEANADFVFDRPRGLSMMSEAALLTLGL